MNERDRAIVADVEKFRCLSRDHICAMHFAGNKTPQVRANAVLKRLADRGYIKADRTRSPYVYLPAGSRTVDGSQKTDHYLAIAQTYLDMRRHGALTRFDVEPKLGAKGTVEPDIFAIWKGAAFFVEVQRSNYSEAVMRKKFARYAQYKAAGSWLQADWQPKGKAPVWPHVLLLGERKYADVPAFQSRSIDDFMARAVRR